MTGIWVRLIKRHRIWKQATRECAYEDVHEALTEVCRELDVPCPLWLSKHDREYDLFRKTVFSGDSFMEQVDFDKLEVDYLDESAPKQSRDPRNA